MLMPVRPICLAASTAEEPRPRNPFQTLSGSVGEGSKKTTLEGPAIQPVLGLRGVRIADTRLVGIICSDESSFAMLAVKDHFTYIASAGSRLLDGQVLHISESGVLFSRSTNRPDKSETVFRPFGEETQR